MKKLMLTLVLLISSLACVNAQNNVEYNVTDDIPETMEVCTGTVVTFYAQPNCEEWFWKVDNVNQGMINPLVLQSQVHHNFRVQYFGCDFILDCHVIFVEYTPLTSFTHTLWKRFGETMTIEPVGSDSLTWYNYQWSTGANTPTIDVTMSGIYTCEISDYYACSSATRTFIVQDNVEVELATCDLESNLNLITWQTNPAQAQYIDHVIVKRDGMQVGTAPYSDGQFTDNIGSGSASRTYTLTAVATDGTECPIVSYPKETIHMAYLTGINNTIEVNWNIPAGYDLLGYNICEWHEDDGSLTVIDYVGASVTSYTCSESQFDEGYIVVQGVEAGKNGETRLLSNRSLDLVGLGENEATAFKVYPNPAKGRFTIEGTGKLTVTNTLGQTILTREIEGKEIVELPRGMYFVKLGGMTRKIVVE